MQFYQKCLKCNRINAAENYTCTCDEAEWTKEYRMIDVTYQLSPEEKARAVQSYQHYDLNDPRGILQYFFTPHWGQAGQIDLQVGLTPFFSLDHLSESYGPMICLKNEGENPSGCFKDRETVMAALHSLAKHKKKAVIYSSGNAAASASLFAAGLGFQLITCVAGDTYPEKVEYIRKKGSAVIRIGDEHTNYEEGYRLFAQLNDQGFFVENGFDNWSVRNPYRILGDKTTALEIVKQYRKTTGNTTAVPDYVVVATGNGSCLAGIWRGFTELKRLGIIEQCPKMVSAAIKNASPIYEAVQRRQTSRPVICNLDNVPESEKEIGSTILAEEGYDSVEATKAVLESGGLAMQVSRKEIKGALIDLMEQEEALALKQELLPEPASLVTLAAIKKMGKQKIVDRRSSAVAVISGHGAKAKKLLLKMLKKRPELQQTMQTIIQRRKSRRKPYIAPNKGRLINVEADIWELQNAFHELYPRLFGLPQ